MEAETPASTTPAPQRSRLAVASLALGVAGLLASPFRWGLVPAVCAVVCGHLASSRIKTSAGLAVGKRLAKANLWLGYIAIVSALLLPEIRNLMLFSKLVGMEYCGAQIRRELFGAVLDAHQGKGVPWPSSKEFSTSTAVFTNLVGHGYAEGKYTVFSGSFLPVYTGTNAAEFKAANNAWCVVADLDDTSPDETPWLCTRNLRVSNLAELQGRVGDQLSDEPPMGREVAFMVFKGGSVQALLPDRRWSDILGGHTYTNRVLRP